MDTGVQDPSQVSLTGQRVPVEAGRIAVTLGAKKVWLLVIAGAMNR